MLLKRQFNRSVLSEKILLETITMGADDVVIYANSDAPTRLLNGWLRLEGRSISIRPLKIESDSIYRLKDSLLRADFDIIQYSPAF